MRVKVFHLRDDTPREVRLDAMAGKSVAWMHFRPVAMLADVPSLDAAFEATNHIDSDWTKGDGVVMLPSGPARSTSVGDMMETEDGLFVVAPAGFVRWA